MNIQSVTVAFSVTDLEKSILWYKKVFGVRKSVRPVDGVPLPVLLRGPVV